MGPETLLKPEGSASHTERSVEVACRAAKELQNIGEYEAAFDAIAAFWPGIGERPHTEGLPKAQGAELVLRAGALAGWLGSSRQVPGAQQFAKALISESIKSFEELGLSEKVAESQTSLAVCSWREGAMDEARVLFQTALAKAEDPVNKLRILVNSTIVEVSTNHLNDALTMLDRAAAILDTVKDDAALGCYYMQRGIVMRRRGGVENLDRALLDHAAARVHFEKANHRRYFARAQNNLGVIMLELGRYDEALDTLEDARRTFAGLGDVGTAAQVDETRSRVHVAQQRYAEAEKIAQSSVSVLERGGELSLLVESLQTLGVTQARQQKNESATETLRRAVEVAETAGDPAASGRALLTMIEELHAYLPADEISRAYSEADRKLGEDVGRETLARLRGCVRLIGSQPSALAERAPTVATFEQQMRQFESTLIRQALEEANGSVTRAARTLGLTHQGLCYIINHRHQSLLSARAPIRVRRKSVIKKHK
ncbi:MAG: helix-turn-helix domain-containing protein [Acidobacteriota bacterium]